jgi:hypothetical protein
MLLLISLVSSSSGNILGMSEVVILSCLGLWLVILTQFLVWRRRGVGWLVWGLLLSFLDKILIFYISLMLNLLTGSLLGTIEGLVMLPFLSAWTGS